MIIADDENFIREGLKKLDWAKYGITVKGVYENGLTAYERLCEGDIDIVIMDINMPIMDGFELAERVSSEMPSVALVVLSCYNEFSYAQKLFGCNVVEYLLKPLSIKELDRVMQKTITYLENNLSRDKELVRMKIRDEAERKKAKNNFLVNLCMREFTASEAMRECEHFGIDLSGSFWVSIIVPDNEICDDIDMLCSSFILELEKYFGKNGTGYFAVYSYDPEIILFLKTPEDANGALSETKRIRDMLYENGVTIHSTMSCALGGECGMDGIYRTASCARCALDGCEEKNAAVIYEDEEAEHNEEEIKLIIKNVKEYVRENCEKQLTLKMIADEVMLSQAYLSHLFKKTTGMRLMEYLTQCRIKKAKEYLKDPRYRINEIANMVGYENARYFSYVFKRDVKMTPNEYRNKQ